MIRQFFKNIVRSVKRLIEQVLNHEIFSLANARTRSCQRQEASCTHEHDICFISFAIFSGRHLDGIELTSNKANKNKQVSQLQDARNSELLMAWPSYNNKFSNWILSKYNKSRQMSYWRRVRRFPAALLTAATSTKYTRKSARSDNIYDLWIIFLFSRGIFCYKQQ